MREQEADRLAIMSPSASLRQHSTDINRLQLVAQFLLLFVGHGVCDNDATELAVIQDLDGVSTEDPVGNNGDDFLGPVLHNSVGCFGQGSAGISHIVDDDGDLILDTADQYHA